MPRKGPQLRLDPNLCDRCGRCERSCDKGALKVGASYIYVDWRACDGCLECARVCDRGAIAAAAGSGDGARSARKPGPAPAPRARAAKPAKGGGGGSGTNPPWTLLEAVAVLVVSFAGLLAMEQVLSLPGVAALDSDRYVLARVAVLAAYYMAQLGVLVLLTRLTGRSLLVSTRLSAPDVPLTERLASVGLTLAITAGILLAGFVYVVVAHLLGITTGGETNVVRVFGDDATGLLFSVLLVVVIAPLAEEVVFRGVLLGALLERTGMWVGISLSAAVFAANHLNPVTLLPTWLLGLAAGWLAVKRASLWPAVGLHALYNLALVSVVYASA